MTHPPIKIVITGASGRMGRALIEAARSTGGLGPLFAQSYEIVGLIDQETSPIDVLSKISNSQAIIDFSSPEASVDYASAAAECGIIHVIGTTGFSYAQEEDIKKAAEKTVIIKSGNFSIGVNMLAGVVERVARLDPYADIEIVEMHHKRKVDAPSGTALLLGEAAAKGRGVQLKDTATFVRHGHTGERAEGTIGFATLRGGTVVGTHTVTFASHHETLEFTHRAESRDIFAYGALSAAKWGIGKPAGLHSMRDVLGL